MTSANDNNAPIPAGATSRRHGWEARTNRAERIVREVRAALPEAVRAASDGVAVVLERRVPRHWLDEGIEPDTLGLFSGPSMRDPDAATGDEAPLVTLFLANILDECGGDEDAFDEEVERTFLHELGHYLGLEEGDMAPRDLD
jgi:predicted Zn-dependent protease with MMP-like domain